MNDSENRIHRSNVRILGLLRQKTSHGPKVGKNYRKSLKISYSLNKIKIERAHRGGRTMIDAAPNKS